MAIVENTGAEVEGPAGEVLPQEVLVALARQLAERDAGRGVVTPTGPAGLLTGQVLHQHGRRR